MPTEPPPQAADDLVVACVRLLRVLRALDTQPKLTPSEASALAVLVHGGPMGLAVLAAHEGVKPPSMTRTVGLLEKRGYVMREPNPEDARGILLAATAQGRRVFRAGHTRLLRPLVRQLCELPPDQRAALEAALPVLMALPDGMLEREEGPA